MDILISKAGVLQDLGHGPEGQSVHDSLARHEEHVATLGYHFVAVVPNCSAQVSSQRCLMPNLVLVVSDESFLAFICSSFPGQQRPKSFEKQATQSCLCLHSTWRSFLSFQSSSLWRCWKRGVGGGFRRAR